ncbi:MAG TPA: hypothetical protein VF332_13110 [Vicinamibacterales bacterium]|jgi:hypothetical protein
MTRSSFALALVAAVVMAGASSHGTLAAADRPNLVGRWTLNRNLSHIPREVGFGMDLLSTAGSGSDSGGWTGGGGTGSAAMASFRESEDDAKRREQLVEEVRSPSPHLTIAQTETAVTITDERGRPRTFHPDGKEEAQALDQVPVATTTRWDGTHLEVRYKVEKNRELHYSYSRTLDPPQLVVQVKVIERGGHDVVTCVYEPTSANEPASPVRVAPPEVPRTVGAAPAGTIRASDLDAPGHAASPSRATAPVVAQGPDADLKGLTTLGVVVEDLSSQAAACGLSQAPIEAAVSKSLSDSGFKVLRNSDEDTYVYVQIITTNAPDGLCVSRYDAFLYTHTTATLSYQATPVLVQVLLLHEGGMVGGSPGTHSDTVIRNVKQYVDEVATRIRGTRR